MSWHLGFQGASLIYTMSSPFPQQKCTMLSQMLNKLISLHALLFRLETFAQPLHNGERWCHMTLFQVLHHFFLIGKGCFTPSHAPVPSSGVRGRPRYHLPELPRYHLPELRGRPRYHLPELRGRRGPDSGIYASLRPLITGFTLRFNRRDKHLTV